MPALSPTMESGTITKWYVKEGDSVAAGDVIADIETDKATMAFEIQDEGVIAKFLKPEGATDVKVGDPVCIMVDDEADVAAFKDYQSDQSSTITSEKSSQSSSQSAVSASASTEAPPSKSRDPRSDRIGPAVRMLLEDHGLTQLDIHPTGPRDIVTKGDVLAAISAGVKPSQQDSVATTPATPTTAAEPATAKPPAPSAAVPMEGASESSQQSTPAASSRRRQRGESYTDIPNSTMRRVIAKRLLESKMTLPAIYVSQNAGLAALTQLRAALKEAGIKVSVNDFVIKAAAMALRSVPEACAGWDAKAEAPVRYEAADISIAVATPGGLITPIVTAADTLTLPQISKAVKDLAGRARENKLAPHEFTGGSFTISNLGMYGVKQFAAIINPPQACILAVGGTQHEAVMQDGRLTSHEHMTATLSADNRVVDEETAAAFLSKFAHNIENPGVMLVA